MPRSSTESVDVIVIGAGAAGLTSAILASDFGASVLVLEKSEKIGGAMSVSWGDIWVPQNRFMKQMGAADSATEALTYLENVGIGGFDRDLIAAYVENAPKALDYLLEKTPVRVDGRRLHDYHSELPGGKASRTVGTALFNARELGEWADRVRVSPHYWPLRGAEVEEQTGRIGGISRPDKLNSKLIEQRSREGMRGLGSALTSMLLKGCLDRGIEPLLGVRAESLLRDGNGQIIGVKTSGEGQTAYRSRRAVVVATGGFDWNEDYKKRFVRYPSIASLSPPCIEGDGLRICAEVGASTAFRGDGLLAPALRVPGEEFDGRPLHRFESFARIQPGSIVVNRSGHRFIDEALNYHDFTRGLLAFDPLRWEYPNVPCWMIFDSKYRRKYVVGPMVPASPTEDWVVQAGTIEELAGKLKIEAKELSSTVLRFNTFARSGTDLDFHRGEYPYDVDWSDPEQGLNPSLGTIDEAPFFAVQLFPALFGTTGGVRINSRSQVLDWSQNKIPRLYACGNVISFIFAPAYPASGVGLGSAITFGYLAGLNAAREERLPH